MVKFLSSWPAWCSACLLTGQNGGTLNTSSCACDCVEGYSERGCESELNMKCTVQIKYSMGLFHDFSKFTAIHKNETQNTHV